MPRRQKIRKHKKSREREAPMSLRDKLTIWAWFLGMLLVFLLYFHFIGTTKQRQALDETINRWRRDYHLTEEQAARVRTIEEEFHGSGNPLFRSTHNAEETREHHSEMANVVNQEDRERFFRMLEGTRTE